MAEIFELTRKLANLITTSQSNIIIYRILDFFSSPINISLLCMLNVSRRLFQKQKDIKKFQKIHLDDSEVKRQSKDKVDVNRLRYQL